MINYGDILEANKTIKTTDIKGKEYAEVNQRIKAFRMVYPEGQIKTEIVSLENGVVVMRAYAYGEEGKLLATGTAYEKEDSTFINKTSYIENCETSAVGRALGMCGFGIDTSVASAEEQQNAELQQTLEKIIDDVKVKALSQAITNNNLDQKRVQGILATHGYAFITEIKIKDYMKIVDELKALKEA